MNEEKLETVTNNLSEKPGILRKEEDYFNSAVLIALILQAGEYHFLFQRRSSRVSQAGEICFPGGKPEPEDANYQETALRETEEELGIPSERIDLKGRLNTLVTPMGVTIDSFVGICRINDLNQLDINYLEVEEMFTIPISYFCENKPKTYQTRVEIKPNYLNKQGERVNLLPVEKLGLPDRYRNAWGGKKHNIYVYETDHGVIWGMTAQLIVELMDNLAATWG